MAKELTVLVDSASPPGASLRPPRASTASLLSSISTCDFRKYASLDQNS
jgi:hypothetical protein